jgi:predicted nucleic acid-binding protein
MILLDTNVISEMMRERPDRAVSNWLRANPRKEFWTSSVVIAELISGVDLMPEGRKQEMLREAIEGVIAEDFKGQILKFDVSAARHYGHVLLMRQLIGRPIREMDALIAATALANDAVISTRNTSDFEHCGITLVNPWD